MIYSFSAYFSDIIWPFLPFTNTYKSSRTNCENAGKQLLVWHPIQCQDILCRCQKASLAKACALRALWWLYLTLGTNICDVCRQKLAKATTTEDGENVVNIGDICWRFRHKTYLVRIRKWLMKRAFKCDINAGLLGDCWVEKMVLFG